MNKEGMSRRRFLKTVVVGSCSLGLLSINRLGLYADAAEKGTPQAASKAGSGGSRIFPTKENPILIDEEGKRVLIYTEVHEMNMHQSNVLWGVVFKDGKFQDRAIQRAHANQLDFHDALVKIGAKPGNNLSKDTVGQYVQGDTLDVKATWPGPGKELSLNDIFLDEKGNPFTIRSAGDGVRRPEKHRAG